MKQSVVFLFIISVFYSCTNSQNDVTDTLALQDSLRLDSIAKAQKLIGEDAKTWLVKSIENEFADPRFESEDQDKRPSIYTPQYEEYKTDAISIDYDGGMTEEQFKAKWSKKYDTKLAGIGNGFLISSQDWGKVKVTSCNLKNENTNDTLVFDVILEDLEFKGKFKRDIKVIKNGSSYLIDDILEY
jgi:hypothetical protein